MRKSDPEGYVTVQNRMVAAARDTRLTIAACTVVCQITTSKCGANLRQALKVLECDSQFNGPRSGQQSCLARP